MPVAFGTNPATDHWSNGYGDKQEVLIHETGQSA